MLFVVGSFCPVIRQCCCFRTQVIVKYVPVPTSPTKFVSIENRVVHRHTYYIYTEVTLIINVGNISKYQYIVFTINVRIIYLLNQWHGSREDGYTKSADTFFFYNLNLNKVVIFDNFVVNIVVIGKCFIETRTVN